MQYFIVLSFFLLSFTGTQAIAQHDGHHADRHATIEIPRALEVEHDAIHKDLKAIIALKGKTGVAAERLADALHEHFDEEQEYAMPPLGVLKDVAAGRTGPRIDHAALLAEQLEREMPKMLAEHRIILERIDALRLAARDEQRDDAIRFADELQLHAQYEEEVLYPATIILGRYLDLLREKNLVK
ncbi:MAG TPA: hypothetical protein VFH43_13820 [Candidatus Kapabacteria bacterium]|jgi:hypothetical protein|nr:hypothetical protein [Candidatus Kapabacteria bacterium]